MSENKSVAAFQSVPVVAGLNQVKGFKPEKYLRVAKDGGLMMELKAKKLWFRLACPNGVVEPVAKLLDDKMAVIEARVFKDKNDTKPVAAFLSTRYADGPDGRHYVAAAQYEAEDQALTDAGFGVQFCDIFRGTDMDRFVRDGAISFGQSVQMPGQQLQAVVQQPAVAAAPVVAQAPVVAPVPIAEPPAVVEPPVVAPVPIAEQPAVVEPPVAAPPPVAEQPPVVEPPVAAPPPVVEQPAVVEPPVAAPPPAAEQPAVVEPPVAAPPVAEQPPVVEPPVVEPPVVEQPVVEQPVVAESPMAAQPPMAEPSVVAEQLAAVQSAVTGREAIPFPAGEEPAESRFTKDMSVEEICQTMTTEEALAITVDVGTCKGWTMAEVQKTRPASLKWYLNGYSGDNNIIRAAAYILRNGEQRLQDAG